MADTDTITDTIGIPYYQAHDLESVLGRLDGILTRIPTEPAEGEESPHTAILDSARRLYVHHNGGEISHINHHDFLAEVLQLMLDCYTGGRYFIESGADLIGVLRSTTAVVGDDPETHSIYAEAIVRMAWMLHSALGYGGRSDGGQVRKALSFWDPNDTSEDEEVRRLKLLLDLSRLPAYSQALLATYFADGLGRLFDWYGNLATCHAHVSRTIEHRRAVVHGTR